MIDKSKIAAVVVWYNPTHEVITHLEDYVNGVERLFVVDNSQQINKECVDLLGRYSNVEYMGVGSNMGIAYALNLGAEAAYKMGYQWLLTMDQDSRFPEQYIAQMGAVLSTVDQPSKVGILAAVPSCTAAIEAIPNAAWSLVETVFTSGNLVRLAAWKAAGGWDDALFIDSVDYDFDFRIQLLDYSVVRCNRVVFQHQLGRLCPFKLFGKQLFIATNHNHLRRYYITRNRLYLNHKYQAAFPAFVRGEKHANLKEFIKIFLFESDKLRKFRSMVRGYCDYKKHRMGKYRW